MIVQVAEGGWREVGRRSFKTPDEKLAVVLSVLKGEYRRWRLPAGKAFVDPKARRNQFWQADFTEFETRARGENW